MSGIVSKWTLFISKAFVVVTVWMFCIISIDIMFLWTFSWKSIINLGGCNWVLFCLPPPQLEKVFWKRFRLILLVHNSYLCMILVCINILLGYLDVLVITIGSSFFQFLSWGDFIVVIVVILAFILMYLFLWEMVLKMNVPTELKLAAFVTLDTHRKCYLFFKSPIIFDRVQLAPSANIASYLHYTHFINKYNYNELSGLLGQYYKVMSLKMRHCECSKSWCPCMH